jgi:cell division protein FtsI/penicillin-binding protein 2
MVDIFRRNKELLTSIPLKANTLLYCILSILLLITLRLWHLGVVQHEKKLEEAFLPRKKVVLGPAARGTIRDRFNIPLATNTSDFRLSVIYSELKEIPLGARDAKTGKRRFPRREYIKALAEKISREAGLDASRVEDLIHSHATLMGNIPLVLKTGLSESQYFRLKMAEKDYPGLCVQRIPKRVYPYGKTACHLVGYLGHMPKERYDKLRGEIAMLREYIKNGELGLDIEPPEGIGSLEEAQKRLFELEEHAYTSGDSVGLLGVEASFESELRGFWGRDIYFSDARGRFIRKLPFSRPPVAGKRVLLTVSIELQEFAEKLLCQSEADRDRLAAREGQKEPGQRGGAIVALDPHSGEILAMASWPRFDPNDFVGKKEDESASLRGSESELFAGKIWDRSLLLEHERIHDSLEAIYTESEPLTWNGFCSFLLPVSSPILNTLRGSVPIADIVLFERAFDTLLARAPGIAPSEMIRALDEPSLFDAELEPFCRVVRNFLASCRSSEEKLLLVDLCRLILWQEDFSKPLLDMFGALSIEDFRTLSCECANLSSALRKEVRAAFRAIEFRAWRGKNEKSFLQEKRRIERGKNISPRPYLDLLDREEKKQFEAFWKQHREEFVARALAREAVSYPALGRAFMECPEELRIPFLKALKGFDDCTFPLYGSYRGLRGSQGRHLAAAFLRGAFAGAQRSFAFSQSTIQGSIFKLVTAYSALRQQYEESGRCDGRMMEITDTIFHANGVTYVGYFSDGRPIPQLYRGGRIPKSLHTSIGKIDLLGAIEASSNPYFSLLAGDVLRDPESLVRAARDFGYGEKTGLALPGEIRGNVPDDVKTNKTGLYAMAIGQHTLVTTPLQTALMLASIANGGKLLEPKIARLVVGKEATFDRELFEKEKKLLIYKKTRRAPASIVPPPERAFWDASTPTVRREIFFPRPIQQTIIEGLRRALAKNMNDSSTLSRSHGSAVRDLVSLKGQFLGKTSTSEVVERLGVDGIVPAEMYRHIWFGGISFTPDDTERFLFRDVEGRPELVVVVYLRYGGYGKQAAPIAAQIVKKWRQIRDKHTIVNNNF